MKSRVALQQLAEVTESQWGMVTTAQARAQGIDHMTLKRLNDDGHLIRLIHGVYRSAGAPSAEHEELRAAWLAAEPRRLALERLHDNRPGIVVSGESAARLHGIGDLRATRSEFTSPTRRQSQRLDVRYRTRNLPREDITVRDGLPATTRERTIADLVEDRQDLSTVADALRDATRQSVLDTERLTELLAPLARRNGCAAGDGAALLEKLAQSAGIDENSWARSIAENGPLMAKILSQYVTHLPQMQITHLPQMQAAVKKFSIAVDNLLNTSKFQKVFTPANQELLTAASQVLGNSLQTWKTRISTSETAELLANTIHNQLVNPMASASHPTPPPLESDMPHECEDPR